MNRIAVACVVAAVSVPGACPGQAQQTGPMPGPMSCSESPIAVPFSFPFKCNRLPIAGGPSGAGQCFFEQYSVTGEDRSRRFSAYARIRPQNAIKCSLYERQDIPALLQTASPWVREHASNFGPMQTLNGGYAMTFTGKETPAPLNCFSYFKYGPRNVTGYENILQGYVCHRDGSAVTDGEMQQFVQAASVR